MATLPLFFFYAAGVAAAAGAARLCRRSIPLRSLAVLAAVPLLLLRAGFSSPRTMLPVDHVRAIAPWSAAGGTAGAHHSDYVDDAATQMAPWNKAVRLAWKSGSLPWRDRWNGCSMPLATNAQSAAFSPWTILTLAVPLALGFTLAAAAKILAAGCGTWLWLREMSLAEGPALFGATALALSGAMTSWLLFPHTGVFALWPWLLFSIELLNDRAVRGRAFAMIAATVAGMAASGQPETLAVAGLGTAALLFLRARAGDIPEAGRRIAAATAAALLGLGLSAFLLVPEAFAVRASGRAESQARLARESPEAWASLKPIDGELLEILPLPWLSGDSVVARPVPRVPGYPEAGLAMVGILTVPLLLTSLFPGRRARPRLPFAVLLLGGTLCAAQFWPVRQIVSRIPVINAIVVYRFLLLGAVGAVALAAVELDRILCEIRGRPRAALPLLAATGVTIILAASIESSWRHRLVPVGAPAGLDRELLLPIAVLAMSVLLLLGAMAMPTLKGLPLTAGWIILTALELAAVGGRPYLFSDPAGMFPPTTLTRFLAARTAPFRATALASPLFPNSNVFAGYEDIRTHDPMERADYVAFVDAAAGYNAADYFKTLQRADSAALGYLSVKYLVGPPNSRPPDSRWIVAYAGADGSVFENPDVRPKVRAAENLRLITPTGAGRANAWAAFGMTARQALTLILSKRETLLLDAGEPRFSVAPAARTVRISDFQESTNRVSVRVGSPSAGPGPILATSYVQDGGWTARDETGRPLPTTWADGPFLAVAAPPGNHIVELVYWPPGFWPGFWITVATIVVAMEILIARRVKSSPA